MSKRKRKKQRPARRKTGRGRRPPAALQSSVQRAAELIEQGQPEEAIELVEPLLNAYPRDAELHYIYGFASVEAGDPWAGLEGYERAVQLRRDPEYWLSLAWLYATLEMNVHALQAFRHALKQGGEVPDPGELRATMAHLEERVQETATDLKIPISRAEGGLRYLETGNRAIQGGDYAAAISANRQAVRMMGDWPPPHNNLALAQFFDGQPQEAMAIARQVLSRDPANLQALGNAIHFLAWTGQEEEARSLWPQLERIQPQDANDRTKMAEAAAMLGLDQEVYDLLKPLDRPDADEFVTSTHKLQVQYFVAVAEANLGKRSARRRFEALQDSVPGVEEYVAALKAKRPGPGWADRFPYHHSVELIPFPRMQELLRLLKRRQRTPEKRFRRQMARFAERFPQMILMAEKLIWEENAPEAGIDLLDAIGTPVAHAALRRFGLSQAGDDGIRMQALTALLEAGEIEPDETLRFWSRGEWTEVQMRAILVSDGELPTHAPDVAEWLLQGAKAFQAGDLERAELKFRQVLERDPGIKEAYNNLAAIYADRGEEDRAKEMAHKAIEIDPLYVFPRCNLALFLLDDEDLEGARAMIRPLADRTEFHPQEMGFYTYIQARIHVEDDEHDLARSALKISLEAWPDNDMAEDLLAYLDSVGSLRSRWDDFWEPYRKRAAAKRARMQAQISTPDPDLATALSVYFKDQLTGMARVVLPEGGWSTLRKAELLARIAQGLSSAWQVERIVSGLDDTQRAALRRVLDLGGQMPWHDFDAEYDNDLEAGDRWQYRAPETTMGALRRCGLLVEATVDGELLVAIPVEPRELLPPILADASP